MKIDEQWIFHWWNPLHGGPSKLGSTVFKLGCFVGYFGIR